MQQCGRDLHHDQRHGIVFGDRQSAGSGNYSAAPAVSESFAATPAWQIIAFTIYAPVSAACNSMFTVAAGATSGLPVAYTSSGPCSNVGATYTITRNTRTC